MRPLRQHQLLPACWTRAAPGRAWPSCRRLRPASRSLHQELWPQPPQQHEEEQLHPRAQQCCLWQRPPKVSASCLNLFTHPQLPAKQARFLGCLVGLGMIATSLKAAPLEPPKTIMGLLSHNPLKYAPCLQVMPPCQKLFMAAPEPLLTSAPLADGF